MFIRHVLASIALLTSACNTHSLYDRFEPKAEGLDKIAHLLEEHDPRAAQRELLKLVPAPARVLLETAEVSDPVPYIQDLAASMRGVDYGADILSMYATSEAAIASVGTLDIIVELVKIDKEKKAAASLTLTDTSEDDAISLFFPAMPFACRLSALPIHKGLDKAIAIILTTSVILHSFPPEEIGERLREVRAALQSSNLLNQAIFSLVNFICPILEYDKSGDFVVDEGEAAAISDDQANGLYSRMQSAIDSIQAMVDANPSDKNLNKALTRCKLYQEKLNAMPAELTIPVKIRSFLVSQTQRKS